MVVAWFSDGRESFMQYQTERCLLNKGLSGKGFEVKGFEEVQNSDLGVNGQ